MRALVTGAGGFAGRHLVAWLRESGDQVSGLVRPGLEAPAEIETREADVLDAGAVASALVQLRPEAVYHLAGLASVGASWRLRRETLETNFLGALSVLEAARALEPRPRVLLVGSAEQYGAACGDAPIDEAAPLEPVTPYGVSKAAQELLGLQYARAEGLPVVLVRAFNHTGPGQDPTFVIPEWARAVARIERGLAPAVLEVGNLDVVRDFSDVRDVVRLYRLLAAKGRVGEVYNACSGTGQRLAGVVETLRSLARVPFEVRARAGSGRRADAAALVGSGAKAAREVGFEPRIPFERTLADVLDDWRQRVAAEG